MIHLHSLKKSILHLAILALPMLPAFVLGFIKHETTRKTIRLIIPVLGFTIIWILMSNAMNYFMRFQYVLLPIIMVSWWPLVEPWIPNLKQQVRVPIVLVIVVLSFGWQYVRYGHNQRYFRDGRQELGTELAKLGGPDLKMAVTEAGNLPLSSGWTALDTWGLNDHQIPKDGVVSVKQLYEFNPDLVMIHDYKSPKVTRGMTDPDWSAMVDAVEMYVTSNDFELLAAFGASPDNSHYYYVRRTSNKYKEIMKVVVKFEYYWYETGERCVNYAENADL